MRKTLSLVFSLLAISIFATQPVDPSQLRIYINPGHGSWGTGDRPMAVYREENGRMVLHDPGTGTSSASRPVYSDTLAFFETNTNLQKCFAVLDYLRQIGLTFDPNLNRGDEALIAAQGSTDKQTNYVLDRKWGAARNMTQNIVMSRVKNGRWPDTEGGSTGGSCNRSLSEICREAQDNNFDMFLAVHSNGMYEGTSENHPLLLYRGWTNPQEQSGLTLSHQKISREMGLAIWKRFYHLPFQTWTPNGYDYDNPYLVGDYNFYRADQRSMIYECYGYLGALKSKVPGILTEGYYHTYQPSRHRAMNWDVDRIEGIEYARGVADYFGLELTHKGNLYGLVRAEGETFSAAYFTPNSATNDIYRPLNGATVELYDRTGTTLLATYTTDNYYNGAFVFFDLEPDIYTIRASHPSYGTYLTTVTVDPDAETTPEIFLPAAGVNIDARISYQAPETFDLTTDYTNVTIPGLDGYSVKRTLANGDNLYILAHNASGEPKIVVYNHSTRSVAATPSLTGTAGDFCAVSDIALTNDGILLAINETQQYADPSDATRASNLIKVYRWANDANGVPTGAPSAWLVGESYGNNTTAGFYNAHVGESMAYYGSSETGTAFFTARANYNDVHNETGNSTSVRVISFRMSGGEKSSTVYDRVNYDLTDRASLLLYANGNSSYILDGSINTARVVNMPSTSPTSGTTAATLLASGIFDTAAWKDAVLQIGSKRYLVSTSSTGLKLADFTPGFATATAVSTTGMASAPATASAAAFAEGNDHGTAILLALNGSNLSRYHMDVETAIATSRESVEPEHVASHEPAPYAYGLTVDGGDSQAGYDLSFSLNTDAKAVTVNLIDTSDNSLTTLDPVAGVKGVNHVHVAPELLSPGKTYSWSITAIGHTTEAKKVFHKAADKHIRMINYPAADYPTNPNPDVCSYIEGYYWRNSDGNIAWSHTTTRGGVQVIDHAASPYNGYIVMADGFGQGMRLIAPDFSIVDDKYYTNSGFKTGFYGSPYSLTQLNGKIIATDYSDSSSNIWTFDPETRKFGSMIPSGATHASDGTWTYNGNKVGCSSLAIGVTGSGADTRLWYMAEDYSPADVLASHLIGNASTVTSAPVIHSGVSSTTLMTTKRTSIFSAGDGLFIAQCDMSRVNTVSKPAFVYVNAQGTVLYNSGSSLSSLPGCAGAMALTNDRTKMAIAVPNEGIRIYNVTWNGEIPAFAYAYTVADSDPYGPVCQMAFDPANNLYVYNESTTRLLHGLNVYSLAAETPVSTVEAAPTALLSGDYVEPGPEPEAALAPFAYGLSVSGDADQGYTLGYSLSGDAESVVIELRDTADNSVIASVEADDFTAGSHEIIIAPDLLPVNAKANWNVVVNGAPTTISGKMHQETAPTVTKLANGNTRVLRGGVQVINDPASSLFGHVVMAVGFGQGFRILDPTLTAIPGPDFYTWSGAFNDAYLASPYTLAQRDGKIYACDYSDSLSDIYVFDPENPSERVVSFMPEGATHASSGQYTFNGNIVGSTSSGIAFNGSGDDTRFWMVTEDCPTPFMLYRYNVGTAATNTVAPVTVDSRLCKAGLFNSELVTLFATDEGVFATHPTTANTAAEPAFVYTTNDGPVAYTSAVLTDLNGSAGAMALTADKSTMAIAVPSEGIRIYNVTWSDGVPAFTYAYTVDGSDNGSDNVWQMAFDPAGNLYAFNESATRTLSGLNVYALRWAAPRAVTPAPEAMRLAGPTGPEPEPALAPFAYGLSVSGDANQGYTLGYSLSGDAESVVIELRDTADNSVIASVEADDFSAGSHEIIIAPDLLPVNAKANWNVVVNGTPTTVSGKMHQETAPKVTGIGDGGVIRVLRGGVQVINDPASSLFGHVVMAAGFGQGFRILDPTLTAIPGPDFYTWSGAFNDAYLASPYTLAQRDGKIYACDYSDSLSDIYVFDPENPTEQVVSFMPAGAEHSKNGQYSYQGIIVGSTSSGIAFNGSGDDTRFWMVTEDCPNPYMLYRYNVGTAATNTVAPVTVDSRLCKAGLFNSELVTLFATDEGVFATHPTSVNTAAEPAFVYTTNDGPVAYTSDDLNDLNGSAGAMALTADKSTMAIAVPSEGIRIYNVTWSAGVPAFTYAYTVDGSDNGSDNVWQMAFDPAGNLYAFNESATSTLSGLNVYALKWAAPRAVTPAPETMQLAGPVDEEEPIEIITGSGLRGEYAYNLRLFGDKTSGYRCAFDLTGDSPKVDIVLTNTTSGAQAPHIYEVGALLAGHHVYELDPSWLSGNRRYTWEVQVYNPAIKDTKEIEGMDAKPLANTGSRGGVTVITDRNCGSFGYIVTSEGFGSGFRMYDPLLRPVKEGDPFYATEASFGDDRNSPYRVTSFGDKVYAADWSVDNSNIHVFDPLNNERDIASALPADAVRDNTNDDTGAWAHSGTRFYGSSTALAFTTHGDETYLWAFADGISGGKGETLVRYLFDTETGTIVPSSRETFSGRFYYNNANGYFSRKVVELVAAGDGVFVAQRTNVNSTSKPAVMYVSHNGDILFNSGSMAEIDGCGSGLALTTDLSLMALSAYDGTIAFFDVAWDDNGVPSLTRNAALGTCGTPASGTNSELCQMAFDPAGNLFTFRGRDNVVAANGVHAYSVKTPTAGSAKPHRVIYQGGSDLSGPVAKSQASPRMLIYGTNDTTDIDALEAPEAEEAWYTLQGIRVDADRLMPGYYIKVSGNKAEKVFVK